jgi:hypothetical protein
MSNFARDLKRGQAGEQKLLERFPTLIKCDGRNHDFETPSGLKVETKFDSTKYTNIFIETISNSNKESPGGCYQSLLKGVDLFVYVFERDQSMHVYRVAELCWFLYKTHGRYDRKTVRNKTYNSFGYAIPIDDLKHLEVSLEDLL